MRLPHDRIWLRGIFGVALLLQLLRSFLFFEFTNSDRNRQLEQSAQLLAGKGLVACVADPEDLSQQICKALPNWPFGYSLLMLPVQTLVGDWMLSAKLLHLLGVVFAFLLLWYFLEKCWLDFPQQGKYALWLFWGLAFTPWHFLGTTDLYGFCFGFAAFQALWQEQKLGWSTLGAALLIALAATMKYAYYPLFALIPGAYKVKWFISREKKDFVSLLYALLIALAVMLPLILFQQYLQTDSFAYQNTQYPEGDPPYWNHLLRMDNFVLKAFAFVYPPRLYAALPEGGGSLLAGGLKFFAWSLTIFLGIKGIRAFLQGQSEKKYVMGLGVIFLAIPFFLLIALSLYFPLEDWGEGTLWTYVEETRYYVVWLFALTIAVAYYSFDNFWIKWVMRSIGIFALCFALLHTGYRVYEHQIKGDKRLATGSAFEQELQQIYRWVKTETDQQQAVLWLYDEYMYTAQQMAAAWAGAGIMSVEEFQQSKGYSSQRIRVFLQVKEANLKPPQASGWKLLQTLPNGKVYVKQFNTGNIDLEFIRIPLGN